MAGMIRGQPTDVPGRHQHTGGHSGYSTSEQGNIQHGADVASALKEAEEAGA